MPDHRRGSEPTPPQQQKTANSTIRPSRISRSPSRPYLFTARRLERKSGGLATSSLTSVTTTVAAMPIAPITSATTQTVSPTQIGQWLFVLNAARMQARVIGHDNGQGKYSTSKRYSPNQSELHPFLSSRAQNRGCHAKCRSNIQYHDHEDDGSNDDRSQRRYSYRQSCPPRRAGHVPTFTTAT